MRSSNCFMSKPRTSSVFFLKKKTLVMKLARTRELEESL
jgi:hypothetical protein